MGILGGEGFSLPVITQTEVVNVRITVTENAINQMKKTMQGDEETHCLVISAQSGGCSGYLYDMKIIEKPDAQNFQIQSFEGAPAKWATPGRVRVRSWRPLVNIPFRNFGP